MPEENENAKADAVVEKVAEGVISPDEAAEVADTTESADDAQAAETGAEETPFDRKKFEAELRKKNNEAANLRKRLKEQEPLLAELQSRKDAEKSDTDRLNDQLAAANERITKTRQKLVRAQVQALAVTGFADPEDAVGALDLDSYIDSDGDIDEAAIEADLQALLERKPHWAKSQPQEGPRRPAPDRTQASGANNKQAPLTPEAEFQGFLHAQLK